MKRNIFYLITVFFISFFFFANEVKAQNSSDALRLSDFGLGFNARALGMGNAYTGLSDDFSAVFFNPAGLGLVKRMEFAGGLHYNKFNNNVTFFNNQTDYSTSATKLDQLSFVFPFPTIRGSFVVAAGYSREKEFNNAVSFKGYNGGNSSMIQSLLGIGDVSYLLFLTDSTGNKTPINGRLNQEGTILSSGGIGKWAFSAAAEVAKEIYIGATLNLYSGTYKRTRDYYEDDIKNIYGTNVLTVPGDITTADFQTFYLNDVLNWDIAGWDAKVGFLHQVFSSNKFGARYGASIKFPTIYTIKESYIVNGRSDFGTGKSYIIEPPLESNVEYDVTTPFVFTAGGSVNYTGLFLNADISYIDYTQMEFTTGLSERKMSDNNKDIKELFRGVANFNVGAEYTIPGVGVRVRGGFILNPSPYKGDPTDYDKKYITGGLGFLADETFSIDAAYAYGWWKDFGDNYGSGVSRTNQEIKYHNAILTFSYRF
ncbi:MAG: hypothetical protein NTX22_17370 [Ignavibacteriales bacterium]|nr:hypothetical protein [Ignavibacteriales bacterium]